MESRRIAAIAAALLFAATFIAVFIHEPAPEPHDLNLSVSSQASGQVQSAADASGAKGEAAQASGQDETRLSASAGQTGSAGSEATAEPGVSEGKPQVLGEDPSSLSARSSALQPSQSSGAQPAQSASSARSDASSSAGQAPARQKPPSWVRWKRVNIASDLDGDRIEETLVVAQRKLSILHGADVVYETPGDWSVSDVAVRDFDGNGTPNILLIVWKMGSFGDARPFWREGEPDEMTQHVFVFEYGDGELVPTWMSSEIGVSAAETFVDAFDRLHLFGTDGKESVWEWNHWGFALVEGEASTWRAAKSQTLRMVVGGDVIAHDSVYERAYDSESGTFDFSPLFARIESEIEPFDVAAVVQETPFVDEESGFSGYPRFGTPTELGDAFANAGFDVVCAATNHTNDRGEHGMATTLAFWREKHPGTAVLGLHETEADAQAIDYFERNGIRLALFDNTFSLNGLALEEGREWQVDMLDDVDALVEDVAHAEAASDFTVCFLHIGEEYSFEPSSEQRAIAERLIDAGADAIISSHPHVVQPVERIETPAGNHGVVFFSLGNLASNQTKPETALGIMAELNIKRNSRGNASLVSFDSVPTVCHFGHDPTQTYLLADYTDALAQDHLIEGLSLSYLQDLAEIART